ncbi:acetylcholinesterase collagenic tail peptide-like [Nothobranchius furzeri]|uniref:Acetylcholinesterase collagenic tail peptide-like n=1 Tax=Nothobranchius furzeri TaxID=105023 RepID=A0A9D2YUS9_NOTFU|nr:acetylcholinesterase collagenic tail peptide-like [Nothobranchius furzeri]
MTLLTLGLYLPLWFSCCLAQSSFLDSFLPFPAALISQKQQKRFSPCCLLSPPPPPLFPPPPALWRRHTPTEGTHESDLDHEDKGSGCVRGPPGPTGPLGPQVRLHAPFKHPFTKTKPQTARSNINMA